MASKGKATNIVTDFKAGLICNKQPKEAKKLDNLVKYLGHYNQDKLVTDLRELGYDVQADYLTRPTQVEEIMFNKSDQLIDILDEQYRQIKENTKLTSEQSEGLGCFVVLIGTIGAFVAFCLLVSGSFTNGGKDGSVFTSASYPSVDTDTTSAGTLSLKATPDENTSTRSNFKPKNIQLVVITQAPTKGKLRLIFLNSEVKPFQILQFETKGIENDANAIIDLPLTVTEVKWEMDK
jgi:hypothetical protein